MSRAIDSVVDELKDQYLHADQSLRPWIIGFSGGKDSTVLLQLVWKALADIKEQYGMLKREIFVVCNDTMVENPIITDYVLRVLSQIERAARDQGMPIYVKKTTPRLEDSFWVNMIGRGYPVPNNSFRWCTERLKIKPTSRFVIDQLGVHEEAIILIGTRKAESATRAKSMKKHAVRGKRLQGHPLHKNTFVYAPIRDLSTEEVWYTINTMKPQWRQDNSELFQLYSEAQADDYECPTMVSSKSHKSCGQSRFGCWVCTVVQEDKSMTAQIENGHQWLKPLLNLRNQLMLERNNKSNRMGTRRNGQIAKEGLGTYSPEYRASVLERLLIVQQELHKEGHQIDLITNQELVAIQVIWYRDLIFGSKVSDIYREICDRSFDMKNQDEKTRRESELLKKVCSPKKGNFELINDLLILQKNKSLLTRKRGLKGDIENRIEEHLKKAHV